MDDNDEAIDLGAASDGDHGSEAANSAPEFDLPEFDAPRFASRRDLARYMQVPLRRLASVLYEADRSRFYKTKVIPKASGGTRTLHAVSGKLKEVQREALDKLQHDFPPSARAHGFVLGACPT